MKNIKGIKWANKTIVILPGASIKECKELGEALNKMHTSDAIVINRDIKLVHVINDIPYEVVSSLKELKVKE